jgi:SAM-dependent methyltransferase
MVPKGLSEVKMIRTKDGDVAPANQAQAQAWDGREGAVWAAHATLFERSVAAYDPALFDAAGLTATSDVLDVGCGTGATSREAGRRAVRGSVLGLDLSAAMLQVARDAAHAEGLHHVRFAQGDAQVHRFARQSCDVALSRTGAMFFADPVAALRNVSAALRPAGRLVLLVWQAADRNAWVRELVTALTGTAPPPAPAGAPGPFSLGDPVHLRRVLATAGCTDVVVRGLEAPIRFGDDADEAVAVLGELLGWLLDGRPDEDRARALAQLRRSVDAHATHRGVEYGSAAWLVTARPARSVA